MKEAAKQRASAQYWIDLATEALCEHGPDALTIDALCRKSGKTKGSFYAHFDSHDSFLLRLAAHWRERNTEAVIQAADVKPAAQDRLAMLNYLAVRLDMRLDQGMRLLAERSLRIAEEVTEVDEARIAYLTDLHQATGPFPDGEAMDIATIEYAAYVGLHLIRPKRAPEELERLHKAFTRRMFHRIP